MNGGSGRLRDSLDQGDLVGQIDEVEKNSARFSQQRVVGRIRLFVCFLSGFEQLIQGIQTFNRLITLCHSQLVFQIQTPGVFAVLFRRSSAFLQGQVCASAVLPGFV